MSETKKSLVPSLGTGLLMTGLGLIVGGVVALGAISAPIIFRAPFLIPQEAGALMGVIFGRYSVVLLVAAGLVVVGEEMRYFSKAYNNKGPLAILRLLLIVALVANICYLNFQLMPQMYQLQAAGVMRDASPQGIAFNHLHLLSQKLFSFNMIAALLLTLLTPFVSQVPEEDWN